MIRPYLVKVIPKYSQYGERWLTIYANTKKEAIKRARKKVRDDAEHDRHMGPLAYKAERA